MYNMYIYNKTDRTGYVTEGAVSLLNTEQMYACLFQVVCMLVCCGTH